MYVEIGTEATQFPEKEYINGIFLAVYVAWRSNTTTRRHSLLRPPRTKNTATERLAMFNLKIFSTFQEVEEIRIHDRRQAVRWCRTP
jgi:hypothetical protein